MLEKPPIGALEALSVPQPLTQLRPLSVESKEVILISTWHQLGIT